MHTPVKKKKERGNAHKTNFTNSLLLTKQHKMKSLNYKNKTIGYISIFINLKYLRLKLLKNKEHNKKICHIFHHNFKNIPSYVMSKVSWKRFYFALFDDGLTLKTLKLAFIGFLIQTLHIFRYNEGYTATFHALKFIFFLFFFQCPFF